MASDHKFVNKENINTRLSSEELNSKLETFIVKVASLYDSCVISIDKPNFPFIKFIDTRITEFKSIYDDFTKLYNYNEPSNYRIIYTNNNNNNLSIIKEKKPNIDNLTICDYLIEIKTMAIELKESLEKQIDITKIKKQKTLFSKTNKLQDQIKLSENTKDNIENIYLLLHYLIKKYTKDLKKNNKNTKKNTKHTKKNSKNNITSITNNTNNTIRNQENTQRNVEHALSRNINKTSHKNQKAINKELELLQNDELIKNAILNDLMKLLENINLWLQNCNILVDNRGMSNSPKITKNKNRHRNKMFDMMNAYFTEYKTIMNNICTLNNDITKIQIQKHKDINIEKFINSLKKDTYTYNICYLVSYLRNLIKTLQTFINDNKFNYKIHSKLLQTIYLMFESIIEYNTKYNKDDDFEKYNELHRMKRLVPEFILKTVDFHNDKFMFKLS